MSSARTAPGQLAIEDDAPRMEETFRELLSTNGIPTDLFNWMEQENVHSAADLPRYCLEKQAIMTLLINGCESTRGQRKLMPFLVKVWEQADSINKEAASRLAKGVDDEEIERPLIDHDKAVDALNTRYKAAYGYKLNPEEIMWPHMLGRIKRERDGDKETMIEIDRVGTEAEGGVSPGTKHLKLGDGSTTTFRSWAGTTRLVPTNFIMMKLWEVLLDGYLFIGSYKMPDGERWFDKEVLHPIKQFYAARVTPWSGPWPALLPCLRSDYLTSMA